jgi:hypothetical protein
VMSALNLCSNGKATVHSVCTAELLATVRSVQMLNVLGKCSCREFKLQAAIKPSYVFMQSARYFSTVLTKFGVFRQIFIKVSNVKFHEN